MTKIINSLIKLALFTILALNTTSLSCLQNTRQHRNRQHPSRNTKNRTKNITKTRITSSRRPSRTQISNTKIKTSINSSSNKRNSFVGFQNNRAICYANAILQCLFQSQNFINCLQVLSRTNKICKETLRQYNYLKSSKPARLNKLVNLVEGRRQSQDAIFFLNLFLRKTGIDMQRLGISITYLDPFSRIKLSDQNNGKKILGTVRYTPGHFYSQVCHNKTWYDCNDLKTRKIANPMKTAQKGWYIMFCKN